MSSHDRDDFAPETQIKREGVIKITNTETGKVEYSATYAASDILDALRRGESIESIMTRCEGIETSRESLPAETPTDNPFPWGM